MGRFTDVFSEEQEQVILSTYFTNPFGDVAFVIPGSDFGPEEQAALAAKFSRDDKPYQAKFMEFVVRNFKSVGVNEAQRLILDIERISRGENLGISFLGRALRADTARFHTQWSLGFTPEERDTSIRGFGDDSIKDAANVLFHVQGLTDHDGKYITQNPKDRPQVVSTRYIDRSHVLNAIAQNSDIQRSRYAEDIVGIITKLSDAYNRFSDVCARFIEQHPMNKAFREHWLSDESVRKEIETWRLGELQKYSSRVFTEDDLRKKFGQIRDKREKDYPRYARKTIFDFTRYFLVPAIPTSLACASDARTLEEDITTLLSSPLITAVSLGEEILKEGRKILPTLLGERTHARRSEYVIGLRQELTELVRRFEFEQARRYEVTPRVNYVDNSVPQFTDLQLAASAVYPYTYGSFAQLVDHFRRNPADVRNVVDIMLRLRGTHDPDTPELLHGGLVRETLIDYGADRDLQRHRRGFKSRQLLNTFLGYEVPDLFEVVDRESGIKLVGEYKALMQEVDSVFRKIVNENPHVAQLIVPFGFRCRRLYSWAFGQDLFTVKLRSGEGGIISYRRAVWDIEQADKERMPEFSRLFRVNKTEYPPELINLKEAKEWYNANKRN